MRTDKRQSMSDQKAKYATEPTSSGRLNKFELFKDDILYETIPIIKTEYNGNETVLDVDTMFINLQLLLRDNFEYTLRRIEGTRIEFFISDLIENLPYTNDDTKFLLSENVELCLFFSQRLWDMVNITQHKRNDISRFYIKAIKSIYKLVRSTLPCTKSDFNEAETTFLFESMLSIENEVIDIRESRILDDSELDQLSDILLLQFTLANNSALIEMVEGNFGNARRHLCVASGILRLISESYPNETEKRLRLSLTRNWTLVNDLSPPEHSGDIGDQLNFLESHLFQEEPNESFIGYFQTIGSGILDGDIHNLSRFDLKHRYWADTLRVMEITVQDLLRRSLENKSRIGEAISLTILSKFAELEDRPFWKSRKEAFLIAKSLGYSTPDKWTLYHLILDDGMHYIGHTTNFERRIKTFGKHELLLKQDNLSFNELQVLSKSISVILDNQEIPYDIMIASAAAAA